MALEAVEEAEAEAVEEAEAEAEEEGLDQVASEESATARLSSSSMNAMAKKMAHAVFRTGIESSE